MEPKIPVRTSSKGKTSASDKRKYDGEIQDIMDEKISIQEQEREAKKRLRESSSASLEYWQTADEIYDKRIKITELQKKISRQKFKVEAHGQEEEWTASEKYKELQVQEKAHTVGQKISQAQIQHFKQPGSDLLPDRWMSLAYRLGMPMRGLPPKKRAQQTETRNELIDLMQARDPDPKSDDLWCPITARYWAKGAIKAAHIYPYHEGPARIKEMFSVESSELTSEKNVMLMSAAAEERFDRLFFALVPDITESTNEAFAAWHASDNPGYRIRVLDRNALSMQMKIAPHAGGNQNQVWNDLDGQLVNFKSSHRVRSRFLYWHYVVCIMKQVWQEESSLDNNVKLLNDEHQNPYWGTLHKNFPKGTLRYLLDHIGHEYRPRLGCEEAALDDVGSTAGMLQVVNRIGSPRPQSGNEEDDSEVDDSEEDLE